MGQLLLSVVELIRFGRGTGLRSAMHVRVILAGGI